MEAAMVTNAKRNEHPRCSCRMCRIGAGRGWGQYQHRKVNRRIRHEYKLKLAALAVRNAFAQDVEPIIVSTGYTD
jgi:hypothetical protein